MTHLNHFFVGLLLLASYYSTAQSNYNAYMAESDPTIDGLATEACWQGSNWKNMDQVWLGAIPTATDFQGRFKVCWRGTKLYILAEIVDNVLYDGHTDPLVQWYNDDCLEIFIDEDNSNGNHQCTYNAFAYHVAINGDNVDLGTDCNPHLYNSHIISARTNIGTTYTWEVAMTIYSSAYTDAGPNTPVNLFQGKTCGFSLAYCDDDGSNVRESFIGSEVMPAGHNDDNYKTADYFGNLNLVGPNPTLGIQDETSNSYSSILPEISWGLIDQRLEFRISEENSLNKILIYDCMGHCLEKIDVNSSSVLTSKQVLTGTYLLFIESHKGTKIQKISVY
jgi:hypothetical protein